MLRMPPLQTCACCEENQGSVRDFLDVPAPLCDECLDGR